MPRARPPPLRTAPGRKRAAYQAAYSSREPARAIGVVSGQGLRRSSREGPCAEEEQEAKQLTARSAPVESSTRAR